MFSLRFPSSFQFNGVFREEEKKLSTVKFSPSLGGTQLGSSDFMVQNSFLMTALTGLPVQSSVLDSPACSKIIL